MIIWYNLPILIQFRSLILKKLMHSLATSCLTTLNLRWFVELTLQVPMQYGSLLHPTLLSVPDTSTTGHHFRSGSAFSFLSVAVPLFFSRSILDTYQPGRFIFHIFLLFHTAHEVLKAWIPKWFASPLSSGPHFLRPWLAGTWPSAAPGSWMTFQVPWLSHC